MNWKQTDEHTLALVHESGKEVAWVAPVWDFALDGARIMGWRWWAVSPDGQDGRNTIKPRPIEEAKAQAEKWVKKHVKGANQ